MLHHHVEATDEYVLIGYKRERLIIIRFQLGARSVPYIRVCCSGKICFSTVVKMSESPLVFEKLEGRQAETLEKNLEGASRNTFLRCNGYTFCEGFSEFFDRIRTLEVRLDDIFVSSVPKAGE